LYYTVYASIYECINVPVSSALDVPRVNARWVLSHQPHEVDKY
jgi:hypothetical protein